jgi:hypothetical protein
MKSKHCNNRGLSFSGFQISFGLSVRYFALLSTLGISSAVLAQDAYHIGEVKANPNGKFGVNPRFINVERDDAAEGNGWRWLRWDASTRGYTHVDSLPFAFSFKGTSVKKFRATQNGIITFGGTVSSASDFVIESLPDPRIPLNSVVVGGIIANGSNDRVLVKTFGTAPNRQLWIKFHSFSLGKDILNQYGTYSYNAVVLEENTNAIHVVRMGWGSDHPSYQNNVPFKQYQANGIQVGPFETYPLAALSDLLNEIPKQGKAFDDNSFVSFYTGKIKSNDASLSVGYTVKPAGTAYVKSGNQIPLEIGGVFTLHGSAQNTDYLLNYQINNESVNSIPLNLGAFGDYRSAAFTHTILRNLSVGDRAKIKVWISLNGGGNDDVRANDTLPLVFDFVAQQGNSASVSKVLLESYTATWCNQCPAANYGLDTLLNLFQDKAHFVSNHVNDNMHNKWAPATLDSLPLLILNREILVSDPKQYASAISSAINKPKGGMDLSINNLVYNPITRKVSGSLEMTAKDAWVKSGLRFGVLLREQNVRGLGSGWDQKVEFSLTKDSQSVFYGKNKSLVGYYHNQVVWTADGGKHGATVTNASDVIKIGEKLSFPFTLTIPDSTISLGMPTSADYKPTGAIYSRFKPADMSVVGYVASDFGQGISENVNLGVYSAFVINSVAQPLWDIKNGLDATMKQSLGLYPNPASGWVNLQIVGEIKTISLLDVSGRVMNGVFLSDNQLNIQSLLPGLYFVRVRTTVGEGTARLVVH